MSIQHIDVSSHRFRLVEGMGRRTESRVGQLVRGKESDEADVGKDRFKLATF